LRDFVANCCACASRVVDRTHMPALLGIAVLLLPLEASERVKL
jgi:hypothetical protein